MASIRFANLQARPTEFLDFTSLTLEEFQALVPPFEAAFQAHIAAWRLDGKPRTTRQFAVYKSLSAKVTLWLPNASPSSESWRSGPLPRSFPVRPRRFYSASASA